jgi:hypothetical protein
MDGAQEPRDEFRRGDIEVRLNHVYDVNRQRGIVMKAEVTTDTASSPELGGGKTVVKGTLIYALFLAGGHIIAPSLNQSNSLGGDASRPKINQAVFDLYYVPKLQDPRY